MNRSASRVACGPLALIVALAGNPTACGASGFQFTPGIADPTILGGLVADQNPPASSSTGSSPGSAGAAPTAAAPSEASGQRYGTADSFEFEFTLGPAFDFDEHSLGVIDVGAHWFVADGVSVGAFIEGIVVDGPLRDAWGFGAGIVARWHFIREDRFSVFLEGGAAFVGFSDDVPNGGTDYDFTPRAAIGATYAISDSARLVGKVGWFHVSNAQTGPDNPGLDSLSVSIGLSFALGR